MSYRTANAVCNRKIFHTAEAFKLNYMNLNSSNNSFPQSPCAHFKGRVATGDWYWTAKPPQKMGRGSEPPVFLQSCLVLPWSSRSLEGAEKALGVGLPGTPLHVSPGGSRFSCFPYWIVTLRFGWKKVSQCFCLRLWNHWSSSSLLFKVVTLAVASPENW